MKKKYKPECKRCHMQFENAEQLLNHQTKVIVLYP